MRSKSSPKQFFQRKAAKISLFVGIVFLSFLIFLCLNYLNFYFQIKTIRVVGNISNIALKGLENLKGSNILLLNLESIKESLNFKNPNLEIDEIVKEIPSILIIKLKTVEPQVALKLNQGYAYLSFDGRVLKKGKTPPPNLPIINFYQKFDYLQITPGNRLDYKELATALLLLKKSVDLNLKVESIDISGLSMIVFNLQDRGNKTKTKKILFTSEKDIEKQSFELETIIKQFKIEAKVFRELDLRFDKPVVKF